MCLLHTKVRGDVKKVVDLGDAHNNMGGGGGSMAGPQLLVKKLFFCFCFFLVQKNSKRVKTQ